MQRQRQDILFAGILAMLVSLFISRALLSVSMIAFLLASLLSGNPKEQVRVFISTPLLWGMSLLFLLPLLSGLWSDDKDNWMQIIRIKLPLILLPFAFAGMPGLDKKKWEWTAYVFIALVTGATAWSMYKYAISMQVVHEQYLQARTMLTPLENDHVRFSWLMSVAALLSGWFWIIKRKTSPVMSRVFLLLTVWLVVFLHILAARTGLLSFYLMLFGTGVWLITKRLKWHYGLFLLVLAATLPFVAYHTLPSFKNRVTYIRYELGYFKEGHYLRGSNDAVRVISLKAGWDLVKNNAAKGVGFGDISAESRKWYDTHYPGMSNRDKIYPSNQWLMYGAGCGVTGFLAICFCMVIPFFVRTGNPLLWWLLNISAAVGFMTDIGLEVQFGVFSWCFIVLWWYKWFSADAT